MPCSLARGGLADIPQKPHRLARQGTDGRASRAGDDPLMTDETQIEETGTDRERALARLHKKRDFKSHLVTYVVVNAALWAVWAATGAGYAWPAWVTGGWAIGLILNFWDVYMRAPISEAEVRREIDRLQVPR
jgi:hypothetical protein